MRYAIFCRPDARNDWIVRYEKTLRNANARINVICKGNPKEELYALNSCVLDMSNSVRLAQVSASFRMGWLSAPVRLEPEVGHIVDEVLAA